MEKKKLSMAKKMLKDAQILHGQNEKRISGWEKYNKEYEKRNLKNSKYEQ